MREHQPRGAAVVSGALLLQAPLPGGRLGGAEEAHLPERALREGCPGQQPPSATRGDPAGWNKDGAEQGTEAARHCTGLWFPSPVCSQHAINLLQSCSE